MREEVNTAAGPRPSAQAHFELILKAWPSWLFSSFSSFFSWPLRGACRISVPPPGIEPKPQQ